MSCDLHTHSYYSDGSLSPHQLVKEASKLEFSAVALTDHNTIRGIDEFMRAGEEYGVNTVAGVEFSTDYLGNELHILALFVSPQHFDDITEIESEIAKEKIMSNDRLFERLKAGGYDVDYDRIKAGSHGSVNRVHFAKELIRLGVVSSVNEAFNGILSPKGEFYQPPKKPDVFRILRFIRSIGAVSVLAHPFLNINETQLCEFLPQAKEHGLNAMEVYYSKFSAEQRERARVICDEFGLLCSGGSDYHGENKPDISLGIGRGDLSVPDEVYIRLKEKHSELA